MVSSTSTGRSPRLLARPARVPRPRGARGTPERASRNPEARASPGDEMAPPGKPPRGCASSSVGSPPDVTRVEAAAEACVAARCHLLVLFRGDAAWEGPGGDARPRRRAHAKRRRDENTKTVRDLESACDAIARVAPVLEFTPLLVELGWDEKSARARADALARPSNEVVVDDATKSGASGDSSRDFTRDVRRSSARAAVSRRSPWEARSTACTPDTGFCSRPPRW